MGWWNPVLGLTRFGGAATGRSRRLQGWALLGAALLSLGLSSWAQATHHALLDPAESAASANLVSSTSPAPAPSARPLLLVSSEFPPLIYSRGSGSPGALGDLLHELGQELGQPLDPSFYPFARALALTQRGPGVLMAPLARTPEREKTLRWVAVLYQNRYVLYGKKDRWAQLPPEPDLKAGRVAVLRGAIGRDRLRGLGFKHIVEEADYPRILRRLDEGTVDFVYAAEPTFLGALQTSGREPAAFVEGPSYDTRDIWLAASPDLNEAQLNQLRAALDKLKRDGRYAKFLQRARLKL
ncbi:hypothetical protein DBR47_08250 [Paucibacter sp. KBW04]|nr:hypothetical protein DBR47_08250 [Paucibacter sp. KBW04]